MEIIATAARNATDVTLTPVASLAGLGTGARQPTTIVFNTGATPNAWWEASQKYRIIVEKCN